MDLSLSLWELLMRASVYVGMAGVLILTPPPSQPLLQLGSKANITSPPQTPPLTYLEVDQEVSPVSKATVLALYDLAICPLLTLTRTDQQLLSSQNITAHTFHVLLPSLIPYLLPPTSYLLPGRIEDCFSLCYLTFISTAKTAVILIVVRTLTGQAWSLEPGTVSQES